MSRPRVIASIEARMGSSRLPGKVLMPILGQPALARMVARLRRCQSLDGIVVATSTAPGDDILAAWCAENAVHCWRGSEDDVLQRVVDAQRAMAAEIVVELTGDCPVIDPVIVDLAVETFLAHDVTLVTNTGPGTAWPNGTDVQVFRLSDLAAVAAAVDDPAVREHVSLYFYEHPERYTLLRLLPLRHWVLPGCRVVLDYPEDMAFLEVLHQRLAPTHGDRFGLEDMAALLRQEPELMRLNAHCQDKPVR